jgi:hypothetical protein
MATTVTEIYEILDGERIGKVAMETRATFNPFVIRSFVYVSKRNIRQKFSGGNVLKNAADKPNLEFYPSAPRISARCVTRNARVTID